MKKLFKNRGFKIWLSVTATVLALSIIILLLGNIFYDVVKIVMGGEIAVYKDTGYPEIFTKQTVNKNQALENGNKLNEQLCEEGFVLLKNDDVVNEKALPLKRGAKISVFGKNSINLVYNGSGSGGSDNKNAVKLVQSLEDTFSVNPELVKFYENNSRSGPARDGNPKIETSGVTSLKTAETPYSSYDDKVKNSYSSYKDAALIVLSRIGGEGWDLPRTSAEEGKHYLELDANEIDLIKNVTKVGFGRVIVLVNTLTTMELGWVESGEYGKVDAALYIGGPGNSGINALAKILCGDVNPSGHTVDTWATDLLAAPAMQNFGDYGVKNGNTYKIDGSLDDNYNYVDYQEGIYVGYRYYETRGLNDEEWYSKNVVYPFGHGLSYTKFTHSIADGKTDTLEPDSQGSIKLTLTVNVRNDGNVAGKDAVQVYVTAPYETEGKIEKPHVVLAGFAKTGEIAPGDDENVTVQLDMYDVASFDYRDENNDGKKCYQLDSGDYVIRVMSDAHNEQDSFTANLAEIHSYESDPVTKYQVGVRFDDIDDQLPKTLSRKDWKMPERRTVSEREFSSSDDFVTSLKSLDSHNPNSYDDLPDTQKATQLNLLEIIHDEEYKAKSDSERYNDKRWDEILDSLSVKDMAYMFNHGAFQTSSILEIYKNKTTDADGPYGFTNFMGDPSVYGTCTYASEIILASTWNVELVEKMGECVGEEGLWGNVNGDHTPYSGWYAPGANIHRTAFGGRNGEYFSEDGFISGKMAASEIKGAASRGVYCYIKHFVANEQETSRAGVSTWLTEQALRELYLKPFEKAVKEGNAHALMSSFNRLGSTWTGGDYRLLTEVLRNEWGFIGTVICDFNTDASSYFMDPKQMIYAGGDLNLTTTEFWSGFRAKNAGDVTMLRRATKNVLYTVSTSNAMNKTVDYYLPPLWVWILSGVGICAVIGLSVWGAFVIRRALKVPSVAETYSDSDVNSDTSS